MLTQDPTADTASFRLSPQQEQLWRSDPENPSLRVQCVVDVSGSDAEAVREALRGVVARHEILRTTFARAQGVKLPGQVIHDDLEQFWTVDLEAATEDELAALLTGEATAPVDLARGPILRAAFVRRDPDRDLLVLTLPAVCADAPTLAIAAAELRTLLAGATPSPAEPLQYADYAEWRAESLHTDAAGADAWSLGDLPPSPELPLARANADGATGVTRRIHVPIDAAALAEGASACRVSEGVFLEACWHLCLARLAGDDEVVVGAVLDGRTHEELAGAAGPYAQVLPLRTTIDAATTVAELVDRVRRARTAVEQNQNTADGAVLEDASTRCRVGFSTVELTAEAGIEVLTGAPVPFVAHLVWISGGEAARAELQLAADAVDADTAALTSAVLVAIVAGAAADTTAEVLDLPLTVGAGQVELSIFSGPAPVATGESVPLLFERRVEEAPERIALVAGGSALTYRELNERSNRLAHRLRSLGVGRDSSVGVCFERSVDSIVAVLGTMKAGGAYVPLNFEHPAARLTHQLVEAGASVLLAETSLRDRLPAFAGVTIYLDDETAGLDGEQDDNPVALNEADDLAYVMYTSGSTGTPKGVGVTHANLANYTAAILDRLDLGGQSPVFAAVSALSTDLGNTSVFPSLLGGGTLHLVPPADSLDGALFAAYLESNPIDVLKITPSHLRALLGGAAAESVLPRSWLVLGGEALPWQLADRLQRAGAACRILNHYGPTETTVGTCTFEVVAGERWGETVPIGAPLHGTHAYVVDRKLRPLPIGVPGELCIGGVGVARGYVGQPEQTAASFVPDPYARRSHVPHRRSRARTPRSEHRVPRPRSTIR